MPCQVPCLLVTRRSQHSRMPGSQPWHHKPKWLCRLPRGHHLALELCSSPHLTRQVNSHSSVAVFSQRGKCPQLKPGVGGEADAVQEQDAQLWCPLGRLGSAVEQGLAFHRDGALGELRGGHARGRASAGRPSPPAPCRTAGPGGRVSGPKAGGAGRGEAAARFLAARSLLLSPSAEVLGGDNFLTRLRHRTRNMGFHALSVHCILL